MPHLSDSCRVGHLPFHVKESAHDAGMEFPLSLRKFIREARCPHTETINLHLKFLFTPDVAVRTMLIGMRAVYNTANISVRVRSREDLTTPAFAMLVDLDVGSCGAVTPEQTQLYANRNNVGANDIVVYFVRETNQAFNGCATHPDGRPGAVVARIGSPWTLAHEVGHVLGLGHCDDPAPPDPAAPPAQLDRLMTGRGTGSITNPPPDLVASEVSIMKSSPLTPGNGD